MVLASIVLGVGGEDIGSMLTFLDLPHIDTYRRTDMPIIKEDVGDMIQNMAQLFLVKGLEEEIRMTLDKKCMEWGAKNATAEFPDKKPLTYNERK
eukprot:3026514-Ditylum_brightwellii.AAC.1